MNTLYSSNRDRPYKPFIIAALALTVCFASVSASKAAGPAVPKSLLMLSVGISDYQNNTFTFRDLKSAAKDANDIAGQFAAQKGNLFQNVQVRTLLNGRATAANINAGLKWLCKQADENSYSVVYLAGHGNKDASGQFYFTAHDYVPGRNTEKTIRWRALQSMLQHLPGKVIVILDSCRSGAVRHGHEMIVFSGCRADQVCGESDSNGYFTEALIAAIRGRADADRNGTVTLSEMNSFVSDHVISRTHGSQNPTLFRPASLANDVPMAQVALR